MREYEIQRQHDRRGVWEAVGCNSRSLWHSQICASVSPHLNLFNRTFLVSMDKIYAFSAATGMAAISVLRKLGSISYYYPELSAGAQANQSSSTNTGQLNLACLHLSNQCLLLTNVVASARRAKAVPSIVPTFISQRTPSSWVSPPPRTVPVVSHFCFPPQQIFTLIVL